MAPEHTVTCCIGFFPSPLPHHNALHVIHAVLGNTAINNPFAYGNRRISIHGKPFFRVVSGTIFARKGDIYALVVQKGMDKVFKFLRVQVVAVDFGKQAHRGFKVSAVIFRIFNSFLHFLCGIANFDQFASGF